MKTHPSPFIANAWFKGLPLTVFLCLASAAAFAQPVPASTMNTVESTENLLVAAGQLGGQNNSYGTVGVITPLAGSKLGKGWVARVFADEVTYQFNGAGNREIDALGLGGSASVGYMDSDDSGWYGVYAGPAYRYVRLSPNDPASKAKGGTVSARIQAEGEKNITQSMKINALAGTDVSSNTGYWARVRPLAKVEGDIYAGPEVSFMGDQDYKAYQVGLALVGIHLTDKTQVGINGGYRKTQDQPSSGYGGVELGSRF